jgi:thiol reductant ABC exporter CydC subunit
VSDGRAGIARTLGIARSARRRLAEASLLGAGAIGASIALMGTSAWLISRAAEHPSEASLTLAIVGVQFFGLSRGFLRYGERLRGHDAALRVLADVRVRVFERLEAIAPAGLPVFRRGDLVARFVDDVDSLQDVVLRVLQPFLVAALVGAGTVAALWWFLPQAGLVLLVALALSATAVPWLTGRLARRVESQQSTVRGELTASVVDLVEGAPELLVMGSIGGQLHRIEDSDGQLRRVARHAAGTTGIGLGLTTALAGLASWGALTLGVGATHAGTLNGALLAVLALVPLAAFELSSPLPAATQALQRSRVAAARVFEAVDAPAIVTDPATPLALDDGPGPHVLTLEGVWASYPGARRAALRGVDLQLSPGRRVALVGPSGAGKSTLADVLVRFLPADAGEATLDGVAMERLAADDVRRVVGLVEQSPHLFDTTLAENLRVGRRAATDAELAGVLTRVGLGPWLDGLPKGLSTAVGPMGGRLSGGQRQRVAVARALLANFPILVLDEPAEHLDPPAADALTVDLLRLTEGQSTLLITHRLAGLEQVDEIVVLDEGRVVERGTHRDLVTSGGRFAELWWDELMNAQPPVEPRPPSPEGLSAVLNEGSDTP